MVHVQHESFGLHVSDETGPLFYWRRTPTPEVWLRPGATIEQVNAALRQAHTHQRLHEPTTAHGV